MPAQTVSPAEKLKADIQSVRNDLTQAIKDSSLSSLRDSASELETTIANLPLRIKQIRSRKYAYNKLLESSAAEFQRQWSFKRSTIFSQINSESAQLTGLLRPLESRISTVNERFTTPAAVAQLISEVSNLKTRIDAAESTINGLFDDLKSAVSKTTTQLNVIEKTLDQCDSASFGFLPSESIVMAVKATWARDGSEDKNDPEGILFLTDQRLIFEQREQVATKKVLFVTTERKLVQQLLFEVPVFSITRSKASKQGMFKNEDWLDLELESGAFARQVKLHLDGQDCNTWQKLLTQAKTRELDNDRAFAVDQVAVEKVRNAPTQCPNCGGALTQPVLRGMDTITCPSCGSKIRL